MPTIARHLLWSSICTSVLVGCSEGPRPTIADSPEPPQVLALAPYVAGLQTLTVRVDGHDEKMIFDTGGGISMLTVEAARALGCRPFGRLTGFRNDGTAVQVQRCAGRTVEVGSWRGEREVGVFDLMTLLGGAPPIDGLVGLDLFDGRAITVDLTGGTLTLETPASLRARVRGAARLRVRTSRQAGGAGLDLFVAVDAPGGPIWLEWDIGNTNPVLLSPHAIAQLGLELSRDEPRPVKLQVSGLGPVTLEAIEHDSIYDGLLNLQFFRGYVFTLDLAKYELWAKPRAGGGPGGA